LEVFALAQDDFSQANYQISSAPANGSHPADGEVVAVGIPKSDIFAELAELKICSPLNDRVVSRSIPKQLGAPPEPCPADWF
jgi:hypothetical protein